MAQEERDNSLDDHVVTLNPIVGVSIERGRYGRALARLAGGGVNFGTDAARWKSWMDSQGR